MLTPSQYEHLCDQLTELYARLDESIIEDITRRMMKTGRVTDTAKWQAQQLQESGLLYEDVLSEIAKHSTATQQHVKSLFEDAGVASIRNDNRYYQAAGLEGIVKMSDRALQTLNAGYLKCQGDLSNLTLTTANAAQQTYLNACNLAYMQVASGSLDYNTAIRRAIQSAAKDGSSVLYPSGHRDKLDVAVRRSVLTGIGQTVRQLSFNHARDMDCDIMELTAHAGARPEHAKWQGKLVSLSGKRGYLTLKDIGYGEANGFGGINCRHDWHPFFLDYSQPAYSEKRLQELNKRHIKIGDKLYTDYEVSQMQRALERNIREKKRQVSATHACIESAQSDTEAKFAKEDFQKASVNLKKAEQNLKDFLKQTGFQNDNARTWVNGFGRSISQKAIWTAKKRSNMDYMARFTPKYSDQKKIASGTIQMQVKKVSNSKFTMYTDIDADRKNKAVRLTEKNLLVIQDKLPDGFKMPPVAVVNFDEHHINPYAIGGYDKYTGIMYLNSRYDTKEKVLDFVNKSKGRFANTTEYAPLLHELGHKHYEDSIKRLAISQNMSYNDVKMKIDRKIYDYIENNGGSFFVEENLSGYAKKGYNENLFTEVIAECFSVRNDNPIAKEILSLLE